MPHPTRGPGTMGPWPSLAALGASIDIDGNRSSRIHYFDSGPSGAGLPPMVLIHGLGDEADSWRHLFAFLAGKYRLLALDLPGFGRSAVSGPTTMRSCAASVLALMDHLAIKDAFLVGSSLGGAIAELVAFGSPARARGLALVDGGMPLGGGADPGIFAMALPILGKRRYTSLRARPDLAIASLDRYYADWAALPDAERSFLEARVVERVGSDSQRRAYLSLLRSALAAATLGSRRFTRGLASWEKTLALVWGSEDRIMPRAAAGVLAALAPRARSFVIQGAGHLPQQERPSELAAILAELAGP